MQQIRAAIFDFGGVLVRMMDDRPRQSLAEQLGIPLSQLDDLVFFSDSALKATRGETSVGFHYEVVRKALGLQVEEMPGFLKKYWSADDVNWELLEFIRKLKPHYKVGLLSNAWDDLRQTLHERWNIDGLFDELIISAEVKLMKPDPRVFQLAVTRLGAAPAEAVFVDDILENVVAAKDQGLHAIWFQETSKVLEELKKYLPVD